MEVNFKNLWHSLSEELAWCVKAKANSIHTLSFCS